MSAITGRAHAAIFTQAIELLSVSKLLDAAGLRTLRKLWEHESKVIRVRPEAYPTKSAPIMSHPHKIFTLLVIISSPFYAPSFHPPSTRPRLS